MKGLPGNQGDPCLQTDACSQAALEFCGEDSAGTGEKYVLKEKDHKQAEIGKNGERAKKALSILLECLFEKREFVLA